jgi:hypothetical protein
MLDQNLLKIPGLALRFSADADLLEADAPEDPVAKLFGGVSFKTADTLSKLPAIQFREQGDVLAKRQGDEWDQPIGGGSLAKRKTVEDGLTWEPFDGEQRAPSAVRLEKSNTGWVREFDSTGSCVAAYELEAA